MLERADSMSGTCMLIAFAGDRAISAFKYLVSARTLTIPYRDV